MTRHILNIYCFWHVTLLYKAVVRVKRRGQRHNLEKDRHRRNNPLLSRSILKPPDSKQALVTKKSVNTFFPPARSLSFPFFPFPMRNDQKLTCFQMGKTSHVYEHVKILYDKNPQYKIRHRLKNNPTWIIMIMIMTIPYVI